MSCLQTYCDPFTLRLAWLSPWNKHMTTGRINQISRMRTDNFFSFLCVGVGIRNEDTETHLQIVILQFGFSHLSSMFDDLQRASVFARCFSSHFSYKIVQLSTGVPSTSTPIPRVRESRRGEWWTKPHRHHPGFAWMRFQPTRTWREKRFDTGETSMEWVGWNRALNAKERR